MPVLINKQTGLAENVQGQPDLNLYDVPLFDANGEAVGVPYEEAQQLIQQGYRQPSPEELKSALTYSEKSSPVEQAKTFAEGAASAATFGVSTGLQVGLGISKPEDIRQRREVNPGVYMAGQATGLIGSALTGVGAAPAMTAAAARLVPQAGATALTRIGTAAAKAAIENMAFQAGDEASKAFMLDPNQTATSVISDVGLSGLLGGVGGGAFGGASELWKLGPGKQLGNMLSAIEKRSAGLPEDIVKTANIDIPVELEAALGDSPAARRMFQQLNEANSSSGIKVQDALKNFRNDIQGAVLETVGKSADDVADVLDFSNATAGEKIKKQLITKFKQIADPITSKFDEFSAKFKKAGIGEQEMLDLQQKLAEYGMESGALKAPSSTENKILQQTIKEIGLQQTAEDLRLYASRLGAENPFGSPGYYAAKQIRGILTNAQDNLLEIQILKDAPDLIADFQALKGEYKSIKNLIEDLNDRLHAGKSGGVESFVRNVQDMSPEDVLRRLSPKGDVEGMQLLQNLFPEVASSVKQAEMTKILQQSLTNGEFNPTKFFKRIDGLTPEMRGFILDEPGQARIEALRELISRIPEKMNKSGTAKTLDALWGKSAPGAIGMATALFTGGGFEPVMAYIGSKVMREAPDAGRLAMLKFLATGDKISAPGFKAMTETAATVLRFQKSFEEGAKAVVGTGGKLVASVDKGEMEKLDRAVQDLQADPERLLALGGNMGDYMPDAQTALSDQVGRTVQYLATLKPSTVPAAPLDPETKPSKAKQARYESALAIAQRPLTIYNKMKDGTLTKNDIQDIQAMYPDLYVRMQQQLMNEIIDAKSKGKAISLKARNQIGLFTGSALDSSMKLMNVQLNQQSLITQPANQNSPGVIKNPGKLDKLPGLMASPGERRQMNQK